MHQSHSDLAKEISDSTPYMLALSSYNSHTIHLFYQLIMLFLFIKLRINMICSRQIPYIFVTCPNKSVIQNQ